jgi:glutaredoxin 3
MPKVTIYTMNYCPFCERAKALLKQKGVPYEEVRVDDDDDAQWDALYQRSGMKTMPQIFADGQIIGGYTELAELAGKDGLASLKQSSSA